MIWIFHVYIVAVVVSAIWFSRYYFKDRFHKRKKKDDVKIGADGVHDHTIDDYPTYKRWSNDN